MSLDWTAGLLGGVMGGSASVAEISKDKRKALAEQLRLEMEAELKAGAATVQHGREKELKGMELTSEEKRAAERIASEEGRSSASIASAEKIASGHDTATAQISKDRNQALKDIAALNADARIKLSNAKAGSAEATKQKTRIKALSDAAKIINETGSVDQANALLEEAGVTKRYEEYEKTPASDGGWFGGATEAETGVRLRDTKGGVDAGGEQEPETESPDGPISRSSPKSDFDKLLEMSSPNPMKPSGGQAGLLNEAMTPGPRVGKKPSGAGGDFERTVETVSKATGLDEKTIYAAVPVKQKDYNPTEDELIRTLAKAYGWSEAKIQKMLAVIGKGVSDAGAAVEYSRQQLGK